MIDTINTDATQDNARTLNNLFAGKQVVNSRDLDLPARSVAFADGTHLTIQAATALPNGTHLNADGLAMDSDSFTNSDDDYYEGKYDSGVIVRAWVETTSEFTDTNGMSAPQVERTITLWALADMFAGAIIEDYSINGGTITLTLTDGDTIAIRHETKEIDITSAEFGYIREEREYVSEGVTSRAAEAIKMGRQSLPRGSKSVSHTSRTLPTTSTMKHPAPQPKPSSCG